MRTLGLTQTRISVHSALEFFVVDALYKSTFTYLLTYYNHSATRAGYELMNACLCHVEIKYKESLVV